MNAREGQWSEDPSHRSEAGASLIMVVLFIAVIGLIVGALLSSQTAIARQAFSTRKLQTRETGTNAGLEWAVNSLRQGRDGFCQGTYTEQVLTLGGRQVKVICKGSASTNTGVYSFALYLNNSSPAAQNELRTSGAVGATPVKNIVGPVYNAGAWSLQAPLFVDGDVLVPATGACPTNATAALPSNLNPLYSTVRCNTTPLSAVTPPAVPGPPGAPAPVELRDAAGAITTGAASCKIWSPGTYTSAPDLAPNNYFKPGVYYFNLNRVWSIGSALRAGDPDPTPSSTGANDQVLSTVPRCAGAPAATAPWGVTFVLGGGAAMKVTNNGRAELFAYASGSTHLPNVVAGGTSIAPWAQASNVPLSKPILSAGVAQPELVLHAGMFAPNSALELKGSNNALETIRNTVVVARFDMFASASITNANFGIKVPAGGEKKYVLMAISCPGALSGITANACTTTPGGALEPPLCTVASLVVYSDDQRTVYVDNWRVDRDATASDPATCDPGFTVP